MGSPFDAGPLKPGSGDIGYPAPVHVHNEPSGSPCRNVQPDHNHPDNDIDWRWCIKGLTKEGVTV